MNLKRLIDSEFVYVVSVYLDKFYRYHYFDEVKRKKGVVKHEFTDPYEVDEYCRLLREANKDYLGRFIYEMSMIPTKASKNFTNTLKLN